MSARERVYKRKVGPGEWAIFADGVMVGRATLTGRRGVDDYPWDCWHKVGRGRVWCEATLRDAISIVRHAVTGRL